jgi:MEMO1 family protein
MTSSLRAPAVAGAFYPSDATVLRAAVATYLREARPVSVDRPRAIIGPHAGYVYSGPVAGSAYAAVLPHASEYRRVVLVGPSHRVWFRGIAAPSHHAFATPLGDVPVCRASVAALVDAGLALVDDEPHRREHGLEVHLPFLQEVLGAFVLVPLVVGDASGEAVAEALGLFWDDPETLLVVSTDLSHFLTHDEARERDLATAEAIEALEGGCLRPEDACGWLALAGALALMRRAGSEIERLDLRDSSDTAGDPARVVGYGAWVVA